MKATHTFLPSLLVVGGLSLWCCFRAASRQVPPTTFPMSVGYDEASRNALTYLDLANVLDGYTGLPADRATFFSGYAAPNDFSIFGWSSYITDAQPNARGYFTTLKVDAIMTSSSGGDLVIGDCRYYEQYQVNFDGSFSYVTSLDPHGQAGQVSQNIDIY